MQPPPDNQYYPSNDLGSNSRFELGSWIQQILQRFWVVLAIAIIVGVLGSLYAVKQVDMFRAVAIIQVASAEQKLLSIEDVAAEELRSSEALNTIAQRLKHSTVLSRVVNANTLTNHAAFRLASGARPTEEQVIAQLSRMLTVRLRPNTRLIEVVAEHHNQDIVHLVANSLVEQYIRENLDEKLSVNQSANSVLLEESERLKTQLEASERALQDYKENNKTTSLADQQNIVTEAMNKINADYTAAKSERLQIESDLEQMRLVGTNAAALLALPSIQKDPTVQSMRARVIDQQTLVSGMTNKYKPKYPKMAQAMSQLADLERSFTQLVLNSKASLQAAYDNALARERSLERALKDAEARTLALNRLSIQYNVLARQAESDRSLYESVLKRIKETDLTKGLEKNAITIAERATRPNLPFKPDRQKLITTSCVGGLLAGLAFAMLLQRLDNTVRTVDQAEATFSLPVLGAAPRDKSALSTHDRKVVIKDPNSMCAEAYRSLVATIDMAGRIEEKRFILFTSALPSEGKSFSSVNYAISHSQKGRKTLLIDFDLRKPTLAGTFGLPADHPGVTDYLLGKATLESLVVPVPGLDDLHILPAGPRIPNPAEQIAKPWVAKMLKEAEEMFDRIILDTPPVNAVSDAVYLLPFSQVICLVIRSGKTPIRAIKRALQVIQRAGASVTGLVLNYMPTRSGGYYYYYYTDGYYGEGTYGAETPAKGSRRKTKPARASSEIPVPEPADTRRAA